MNKILNWFHNNKRPLTVMVEVTLIFLAATLGGVLSYFISKMNLRFIYLILIAVVIFVLITIIVILWDIYNKPARLYGYEQLNRIERQISEIYGKITRKDY